MAPESSTRTSNGFLSFLGVTAVLGTVLVVAVGALAFTGTGGQTLEQRRAAGRLEVRTRLEKEAQEKLTSEGWVDKAKGLVHISVTDAIPLVVAELKSKKPAPSQVKVEPPLPIIPVPDPNSKEPPPLRMPSAPQGADTMIRFALAGASGPGPCPAAAPGRLCRPAPASCPLHRRSRRNSLRLPRRHRSRLRNRNPLRPHPPPGAVPPACSGARSGSESALPPLPAPAPAAPARPPLINPTENPAPTK